MPNKKMKKDVNQKKGKKDSVLFAFLATFLSIIGFVIALISKREDRYVMYYAKQSLVIFIIGAIAGILGSLLKWIPIIGTIVKDINFLPYFYVFPLIVKAQMVKFERP